MCILLIHSNGHSSVQTVDRNKRTTPFYSYHRALQEPHLKSASHLTVFSQLVRQLNSCVNRPYIQTAITQSRRSIKTSGQRRFYSFHRASQESHLISASHLTVFSQLVRQPNSCVNHPYIQTAITSVFETLLHSHQLRTSLLF